MPKSTGPRFRQRKINFRSRIAVRTGLQALDFDEEFETQYEGKDALKPVVTGVDKEEEDEVHLQAVLASSSASVAGTSFTLSSRNGSGLTISTSTKPKAYIPTPDSNGTIDEETFNRLYPPAAFVDPITYIKYSDTVEEAQIGAVNYTMDEDDEDWLIEYNSKVLPESPIPEGASPGEQSRRKEKGKMVDREFVTMTEDDFEAIMELFETVTEEKAPMAHVNPASLPEFIDFDSALSASPITSFKLFARSIYPHWKERRLKRTGKAIIPQLDYDETNEQNPYVCFRRRELKTSRKTRRSDAQNIERLVRLRNDLFAAHALMIKTREREKLKLETLKMERAIFESRIELRDFKRRVGEAEGDEDILIGKREKKRKRDDPSQPGLLRLSLRKPDAPNNGFSPIHLASSAEDLRALKERAAIIHQRMERDLLKKKESDAQFEDHTDNPYIIRLPATPARFWRAIEPLPGSVNFSNSGGLKEAFGFTSSYQQAVGVVKPNYRRRIGRGGRVMLDRIHPATMGRNSSKPVISDSEEDEEDYNVRARREERFRFDSDAAMDFPMAEEPTVVDDYAFRYMVKRAALLKPVDVESLMIDGGYIEEAYRYVSREPEKTAPPQVVNRLAPPPPLVAPARVNGMPTQMGGPGGIPVGSQSAQEISRLMGAAAQAQRLAQQQAQYKRANPSPIPAHSQLPPHLGYSNGNQPPPTQQQMIQQQQYIQLQQQRQAQAQQQAQQQAQLQAQQGQNGNGLFASSLLQQQQQMQIQQQQARLVSPLPLQS